MYLSNIKLWNFRKYWPSTSFENTANLDLNFEKGINILIWANDSWKTAILDAIKLVLKPNTWERIKLDIEEDFFEWTNKLKIELTLSDLLDSEARHFTEFLDIKDDKVNLVLSCEIHHNWNKIFHYDIKTWKDWELGTLSADQKELLNITYLKPLRDVKAEFIPKKNSRLSSILQAHKAFKNKNDNHVLMTIFKDFDDSIKNYFRGLDKNESPIQDTEWQKLKNEIDAYIKDFLNWSNRWEFSVSNGSLKNILERLFLTIDNIKNPWLWTLNRLFIASELLHLEKEDDWLKLGLIEEIEAHIHPQAQLKVIEVLQKKAEKNNIQLILTTHSPNLASQIKLKNLIICNNNGAFPMGSEYTELQEEDYRFLERFIDVTKSNLFFSEWIIFVEWRAEEIILPTLAKILTQLEILKKWNLTENQVSIVNIGHTNFKRYKKIFERKDQKNIWKNIAIITDLDIPPNETNTKISNTTQEKEEKLTNPTFNIKGFISPYWTLEYCLWLFKPFRIHLYHAILLTYQEQRNYINREYVDKLNQHIRDLNTNSDTEIEKLWTSDEDIALKLYQMILWEESIAWMTKLKLSKTIIAQYFSEILDDNILSFQKRDFENPSSISYLINAIKYACKEE